MRLDPRFGLLLLCFFLSGLAGLIYETAWTREFSFVFGTSSLAVATVLAAYMAGLAAGAAAAARFAHRVTRPILAYGLLELGIALAALAIPWAIRGSQALYLALFGGLGELPGVGGLVSGAFYAVCSFAILMVPTAMMGATLPLLARHAVRREQEITGRIGLLYAINTAGAVAGTLIAAYGLLPSFGLRTTIWIAAGVNGAVFLAAWALARAAAVRAEPLPAPERMAPGGPGRWILPLIFGSGVASFSYEVLWVRLLDHVLGGNAYAFATMLAAFLTGIAAGSALATRLGRTPRQAAVGFVVAQIATALLSLLAFLVIDSVPGIAAALGRQGVPKPLADALISMLTLFPGALFVGMTFPFAVRILARHESEASPASARVYSANTLGSIVGALGSGFFVIPWLGYPGTLSACVAINTILAALAALAVPFGRRRVLPAAAVALTAIALVRPPEPWRVLRIGVDVPGEAPGEVTYYGVGRSSTVLLAESTGRWKLVTNGLSESLIDPPLIWHNYGAAERWMGALPVLARPGLESLLLIGLGGGVTLEAVPRSVERVDVVELEREVVAANRAIAGRRWRDPLADPRVRLRVNDARNSLLLASDMRFGAIVSQPSHPWTGGASNLYTREFFELVSGRLVEDGVLVQWMGLEFIDEDLFRGLLATLRSVFPFVRVYLPPPGYAAVFVASHAPLDLERSAPRALEADPEGFAELGITVPEDVTARLLLDEEGVRSVAADGVVNRDDHNLLRIESSRVGRRSLIGRMDSLYGPLDPLIGWEASRVDPFLVLERSDARRRERLAGLGPAALRMRMLGGAEDLRVARAIAESSDGKRDAARERLAGALERAPEHRFGRAARLRLAADDLADGADPAELVAPPLAPGERTAVAGWRALGAGADADWTSLDRELAALSPRDPLYRDAQLVRARWRIASGDPALAREAVELLDRVLHWTAGDLILRARACLAAGEIAATLDTLHLTGELLVATAAENRRMIRRAGALLEEVPKRAKLHRLRESVEVKLRQARDNAARAREQEIFRER